MAKKLPTLVLVLLGVVALVLIELRPWRDIAAESPVQEASQSPEPAQKSGLEQRANQKPEAAPAKLPETVLASQQAPIRAQLSPTTFTTITGELTARVQSIPKREGETFEQGEPLVIYDCSAQRAQLEKNKALVAIAQRNFETNRQLLALGSVSKVEHDNSLSELEKAQAEGRELTAVISRCQTLAPFPGRVAEQRVRSQQFVQVGQPLLDIQDDRSMELEFIAPSRWSPWLKVGYEFRIRIDETGRPYPARVTRVAARIDSVSQTFKVVAVITGTHKELSAGMSGTLLIEEPKGS